MKRIKVFPAFGEITTRILADEIQIEGGRLVLLNNGKIVAMYNVNQWRGFEVESLEEEPVLLEIEQAS